MIFRTSLIQFNYIPFVISDIDILWHHLVNSLKSEKEHGYSYDDYNYIDSRIWRVLFFISTCKAFLNDTIGKSRSIVDNVLLLTMCAMIQGRMLLVRQKSQP